MKSIKYLIVNALEFQRIIEIVTAIITVIIIIRWDKHHNGKKSFRIIIETSIRIRFSSIV